MTESPFGDSGFVVLVFSPGDYPIACLNKEMAFLTAIASSRFLTTNNQLRTSSNPRNQATIQDVQGEILQVDRQELLDATTSNVKDIWLGNALSLSDQGMLHDCDDLLTAQAVLMANISNYGSDIISDVPNSKTYLNDMDNQSVQALQDFKQTPATVQDTNLQAQQDSMILSVIEQMSEQMINHVNNWEKANKEQKNESITAELERYKERVKTFEQRLNIDLSSREKMIDSQMDDMIREKLALKEQIDSLEQNLSKQIKEKESLFKTFSVFKNESKEKENKYMENEIDLEKKIKELDNIICKVGQSAQTVHMLTKPQAFYDNTHKQALGYQNPFYLKKAQRIKPTLYDGVVFSNTHVSMPVIDDEETLILEEESRLKMSKKAKDPEVIAKKISHKPIDYEKLNSLTDDFEKRFSPQQELSAEQAFWFHILNPSIESSYTPPVIVEVPSELPKVSLVNASLKKLKFHLTQFDSVVKKRTIPNALEEARLQDKDTTICKLKITIRSLSKNTKEENVNHDKCELEPINEELENSVAKLLSENERLCNEINHVKQVFKDQFDSIKQTCIRHKEQSDSLINKLYLKSVENEDLKAQNQDKVFVITSLKNNLQKLKGKEIVKNVAHTPSATTIDPGMFKLNLEPLPPSELDLACKYATRIQELLVYVQDTCPNAIITSAKKVTVKPMNNVMKVRFAKPLTSSSNIKQVESLNTSDFNKPVLSSTGVKCSTSNCESKPLGNKRNDRISQTPSRNKKNKVEAQPRKVNKVNRVVKPVCDVDVKHSLSKANFEILCAICNKFMFDGVHDKCLLDLVQNGNKRTKSSKKHIKQNIWKPTGHVFTDVVQIVLWYLDSGCSKHMTGNRSQLMNFVSKFLASKTKTWLWHRRLSHLNFGTLNKLAKDGLARGIPRLKFQKDHLCSACALGKSKKKSSHQPNAEDTNQEKLYLLHMDLCSPMRVASINGKRYILVIVDDYSRFTCVRYLKTKDEALAAIIKCIKNIQVRLKATVRNVQTDNGTKFVNQTLHEWYENVGITHQTSVARTPQQNGVVERRNWTLMEAAQTMLIFFKALLFLWAEAINIACYTQNRSLIRLRYNKTPYEVMQDKKPDLSFFHVFGSLCYPTNDHEDLGKFDAKADIGIFVGYALAKKTFKIYNRRSRIITETIHVTFDELTAMASEQFNSGPGLQGMTPTTSSTRLGLNPISQQPCLPPIRDDWDRLFQQMFNEYFNPSIIAVSPVPEAAAPRAEVLADSPVSTFVGSL
ncbi:retrovirus-related pol polyprotein from transposon TNT 1-94 [Tanacetum coccineum]|uniref:Retrovirus-related pol polyprotein from transposon TNT 1-94 n=1 Tax=Tanacetum coccineum TaxID=301880 RepID=A0ABQ4X6J8_9ASTR